MDRRVTIVGSGNTIIIAASQEDTGGAFALLDYELAPGFAALPPHRHQREDEAAYVLEGRLCVRVGRRDRYLEPGEFVLLRRGVVHALRNIGPRPARFMLLLIPAGFEQCLRDLDGVAEGEGGLTAELVAQLLAQYGVRITRAGRSLQRAPP
jgi:quercetin dioxygenase-like cupin family protein